MLHCVALCCNVACRAFQPFGLQKICSVHLATHLIPGRRLVTRLFKSYEEPRLQIEQSEEAKRSEAKLN